MTADASARIRDLIGALDEDERTTRWEADGGELLIPDEVFGPWPVWVGAERAAYIALMGPHVGEKVAALLEAIRGDSIDWHYQPMYEASAEWRRHIFDARDDLEAAIEQGGQQ